MVNDSIRFRREFVAGVGTVITAAIAGCSSSGDSPGDGGDSGGEETTANTATATPETTDSSTSTVNSTTDEQGSGNSSLYEDDEPQAEREWERKVFGEQIYPNDGWIEMENPIEQMPEENIDFDRYPNLQLLFDESLYDDVYSDENEAIYLTWLDEGDRLTIGMFEVKDYEDADRNNDGGGSNSYTEETADVRGILDEVVEGVDDVSENISDEYAQVLRNS